MVNDGAAVESKSEGEGDKVSRAKRL